MASDLVLPQVWGAGGGAGKTGSHELMITVTHPLPANSALPTFSLAFPIWMDI